MRARSEQRLLERLADARSAETQGELVLAAVAVVALNAIVAAGGGGGGHLVVPQPAPPDAPSERQRDALERGVRQLGGR